MKIKMKILSVVAHAMAFTVTAYGATGSSEWFFVDTTDKPDVVVHFNANGGVGNEMDEQVFIVGEKQKLIKNTYAKNGYVFQGWAESKADADNGAVRFRDEAEITIDANMTLYAVWANPTLTLVAESANWARGSITLCCTDADTSGAAHTYTLQYYDESTAEWKDVASVQNTSAGASLTDPGYSSRLGGIPPVEYRVKDENGRASAGCVTRNRHGLFVGVGEYENAKERGLSRLPEAAADASKFKRIAKQYADFDGPVYANQGAKVDDIDSALDNLVDALQCGDICLFYVTTHGDYDGKDGLICLYDDDYTHAALTKKVSRMADKGIAFIAIVGTCHAEAMLQMDLPNAAVVAAATMKDLSTSDFEQILMDYGWSDCYAATGSTMTFKDLVDYSVNMYNELFAEIDFVDEDGDECYQYRMTATKNDVGSLLGKIVARTNCVSASGITKPSAVTGLSATTGYQDKITVSWNAVQGADMYYLFYGRDGFTHFLDYDSTNVTQCTFYASSCDCVGESSKSSRILFAVKALNGAGASSSSETTGWISSERAVTFNAGGGRPSEWRGNIPTGEEVSGTVEKGAELGILPTATKDGFVFVCWRNGNEIASPSSIVSKNVIYRAEWTAMTQTWLNAHPITAAEAIGDIATAAAMTAANGCRTVGECYALGINPEDPDDDLKIAHFEIGKDGKPVIMLNHTEDGSGNSFMPRVKTLGKADLSDAEWREVPEEGDGSMRFFKVEVEMP